MAMRLLTLCLLLAVPVHAKDQPIDLRLLPLAEGLPKNLEKSTVFKTALSAGVDLRKPSHPIVVASYRGGSLFHLFYKSTENAFGNRPYLIQRMKRVRRSWKSADAKPEETVEYKVEVFKTIAGALKRPDTHWGDYGIGAYQRREVIKEYDIGFGEIPGVCEGELWPYDKEALQDVAGVVQRARALRQGALLPRAHVAAGGQFRHERELPRPFTGAGFRHPRAASGRGGDPAAARTPTRAGSCSWRAAA